MRWSVGSLTAAAAAVMVALSVMPATQAPVLSTVVAADPNLKALAAEDSANAATHAKLAKPITIEMVETPLNEAVEYLASTTGAQIYVKWRRLADEGTEKNAPVTIKLKEVPADLALSLMLEQVGGDVRYTVERGVVIISSSGDLDGKTSVCVYNVRDLLTAVDAGTPRKASAAGKPSEKTGGDKQAGKEPPGPADELIETLTSTIVPASWDTVGGPGSIALFNGLLVVNQTSTIQTEMEKLLRMLREAEQQPAAKPATK